MLSHWLIADEGQEKFGCEMAQNPNNGGELVANYIPCPVEHLSKALQDMQVSGVAGTSMIAAQEKSLENRCRQQTQLNPCHSAEDPGKIRHSIWAALSNTLTR